jgi:hypothetical protein
VGTDRLQSLHHGRFMWLKLYAYQSLPHVGGGGVFRMFRSRVPDRVILTGGFFVLLGVFCGSSGTSQESLNTEHDCRI